MRGLKNKSAGRQRCRLEKMECGKGKISRKMRPGKKRRRK